MPLWHNYLWLLYCHTEYFDSFLQKQYRDLVECCLSVLESECLSVTLTKWKDLVKLPRFFFSATNFMLQNIIIIVTKVFINFYALTYPVNEGIPPYSSISWWSERTHGLVCAYFMMKLIRPIHHCHRSGDK